MAAENHERAHVHVSGRVQGVFFRDATSQKARELSLSGWVRNLPDGRVEALFEGPSEAVRHAVQWCETGPPGSEVKNVDADFETARADLNGFEVR
ncbi:MAG: acylphosphatase [Rubrobacteraceae bacterium]